MAKQKILMPKFTIAYDLHSVTDRSKWEQINNDIMKSFPSSAKLLNTTFFIATPLNTQAVSDTVKAILSKYVLSANFEYIVFSVDNHSGWLSGETIQKMEKVGSNVSPLAALRR